ncbi:M16 family metallopeptidase [Candidatus Symbiothrix dinenymphae]|uniref:M16 family metallopeptidase n=1 Tax=Candidatus Symbiothrix dinenymphae TaxID=467085 RepID=UPI00070331BD|nr:M16 family metallopeptidase [Candidatus Symbiothrix dinenymphae]
MKKTMLLFSAALLLVACGGKGYETVSKTDGGGYAYEEVTNDPYKARVYTLKNGLKVYLSKNTDEPRIQTVIAVRAGSKDEPRDNTGLAHYLEHMMFKGTDSFGTSDWTKEKLLLDSIFNLFEAHKKAGNPQARKAIYKQIDAASYEASKYAISNEYDKLAGAIGASGTNAFTSYDLTAYVNEIPANKLEPFIKLEYDRFLNMQLRLFHTELETVYEEYNRSQDNGYSLMWNKVFAGLFEKHPYQTSVIGLPEHLKSPSMYSVMAFQKKYYVPDNMAVLMTGDLDFEKTIKIVDTYFGQMQASGEVLHSEPIKEEPVTAAKTFEIATPDQERVIVAYRFGDAKSKDALYLDLIGDIFNNGKAGLIDLDLLQKQKVLGLNAGAESLTDYGIFVFMGTPREGQSLEEISGLIQDEIQKLKAGDFDEELLQAIINNKKLSVVKITDSRQACYNFLDAFITQVSWKDYVSKIDEMAKITKAQVVDFANTFFAENYVTVYKRTGENKEKVVVEKPSITAVLVNRDNESPFAKDLLAIETEPIEPVFVDFKEAIKKESVKDGIDFYYTKNVSNKVYSLNQFVEISNITDKKLALAFRYLPYLGTSKYTPEALKMEMYKLAMSFNTHSSAGRSYVNLSGLDETMPRSLALMEEMMQDAVVNKEAYDNLVNDILKERANAKLNKGQILRGGLVNYAKFGAKSAFTDILTEQELRAIDPQELVDIVKRFASYKHGFAYYGPDTQGKVLSLVKKFKTPDVLQDVPARVEYPELPMDKPVVYFADYDMVQAEIFFLAKDKPFDPALMPAEMMFNTYYGGGMNSIVFQEIREARALAYSAYAYVSNPARKGFSNYVQAYVGTQADKMANAMDAFRELLVNMPSSEKAFEISKETALNNMRSERWTKSSVFWNYLWLKDLGIDYDHRKPVFEGIQAMTLSDVQTYFDQHVKPAQYSVLLIGKRDKIDFKYLNKIATVKELSLDELFGY